MSPNWLHVYLADAVARNLCIKAFCTTCGASEFRQGLRAALQSAAGQPVGPRLSQQNVEALARALAGITPDDNEQWALAPTVRCVLIDLTTDDGGPRVESLLGGTWAGTILAGMKAHHATRQTACRAHEELQQKLRLQRVETGRLKHEQHRTRLELKKERDRLWREKSGRPEAT